MRIWTTCSLTLLPTATTHWNTAPLRPTSAIPCGPASRNWPTAMPAERNQSPPCPALTPSSKTPTVIWLSLSSSRKQKTTSFNT
ncbi:hypothetical protein FB192DRAFT_1366545 [Mucor lusitanicus]|uniref:Secreted protein n=1 Tax=Mucor circinelloides f. lusitanicus TaxID=29924 RepID=A0A8H4BIV7_MUCCL|nr:hypothetical protein FB192DRAFT_1366545 [Mucor lusitanicus]